MTFKEMQDEVYVNIKDASLQSKIPGILNDAYKAAVNDVHVPDLKSFTTVNSVVGKSYTSLPDGVIGRVLYIGNSNGRFTLARRGLVELIEDDPGLTSLGSVWKIAQEGKVLWYISQPETVETFYVLLYKEPAELVADNSVPSVLPSLLHRQLLVYKATSILYNIIEEGVEGEKVNTISYENLYQKDGVEKLREWLAKQRTHSTSSIWSV
jgi:hypothetical protein